ncbi:hypothetical protein PHYBLDRAFT_66925 [Phycomyces blakesleeanus NRRL 1555(-)]|uniref:Uncharacterized protein n=1 Tax=Phycomyces blakesleeanus (strain ATCC 8743b / DSM 1359 / FGSC 10004 / NBRC 33097 / NRRL 1555) TaxID=763407 RepID=A0A167KT85_PHYB8|nr:hypothetical protein PHYBLDRAFT_66925 [Phycomyces blakesleeanus NRRL 1555(-)]OAD68819.1 hypothetical protein PHYBLDRAFT_66925 [Phycomyces blakesleeanus NRRL 1555(-)]|eukprot:XP_018286859.1 hypothetical protein PHYBLDRAFT_66925 [Phycomyces blakesleeanus NRRL 1555(-)]
MNEIGVAATNGKFDKNIKKDKKDKVVFKSEISYFLLLVRGVRHISVTMTEARVDFIPTRTNKTPSATLSRELQEEELSSLGEAESSVAASPPRRNMRSHHV